MDEPSQPKSKKRSFNQDSSIGDKDRFPTKITKDVVMLLRGLGMRLVGRNTWVSVLTERMVSLGVIIRVIR